MSEKSNRVVPAAFGTLTKDAVVREALRDGDVHVWRAELRQRLSALPALATTLSPEELAFAGRASPRCGATPFASICLVPETWSCAP